MPAATTISPTAATTSPTPPPKINTNGSLEHTRRKAKKIERVPDYLEGQIKRSCSIHRSLAGWLHQP
jgi:hypothetical protein